MNTVKSDRGVLSGGRLIIPKKKILTANTESRYLWRPQEKQRLFMSRLEDEGLYGGAAGGGKSDCALVEALRQVHIPHYKGIIFRKTYPQLRELIGKSKRIYPA